MPTMTNDRVAAAASSEASTLNSGQDLQPPQNGRCPASTTGGADIMMPRRRHRCWWVVFFFESIRIYILYQIHTEYNTRTQQTERSRKTCRPVQNAKKPPKNAGIATKSLEELCITTRRPPFVSGDEHRKKKQRRPSNRGRRSSIAENGFVNHQKEHRGAHLSLWRAGRGPAPSSPPSSRSSISSRRRRGEEPDPPAAVQTPSTSYVTIQTTAGPERAAAIAPAHKPPSSQ